MEDFAAALAVGFGGGIAHAFDADHVVAVSTLLHRTKKLKRVLRAGIVWGAGHTTTLLGGILLIKVGRIPFSEVTLGHFELPVALMLILLGARAVYEATSKVMTREREQRPEEKERNAASGSSPNGGTVQFEWQSYVVGMVHGLAGSGALMITVSTTLSSFSAGVAYALVFGIGSMLGMAVVTGILILPYLGSVRVPLLRRAIVFLVGGASVVMGIEIAVSL